MVVAGVASHYFNQARAPQVVMIGHQAKLV